MNIDWWTIAFQSINALVLIWLLSRFLFKPVAKIIQERQVAANDLLDEAQDIKSLANDDRIKVQQELKHLESKQDVLLAAATEEASSLKSKLLAKAADEAEQLLEQSKVAQSRQQQQLDAETRATATQLALDITKKLMERLPAVSRVAGFTDGLIEGMQHLSKADRQSLLQDNKPLVLSVAYPLTEQEATACLHAITHELGGDVSISVSTDPSIIAGLELIGSHCAVRNNFRTDIAHLATTLQSDEASAV